MPIPVAAIGVGLQIGSQILGFASNTAAQKKTYEQNVRINNLLKEQLSKIPGMEESVNRLYQSSMESLGMQESREMYKNTQGYEATLAKSGFESSGALSIQKELGADTIYDLFNQRRLETVQQRESQLNQLSEQKSALETQQASLDLSNPTRDLDMVGDLFSSTFGGKTKGKTVGDLFLNRAMKTGAFDINKLTSGWRE